MGKKNPYVFTIGFDRKNPEHQEVVEILNATDKKAALIADVILQYTGRKPGGDGGMTQEGIQAMVRLLIRQEMERLAIFPQQFTDQVTAGTSTQKSTPETEMVQDLNEEEPPLDETMVREIADAMAAFKNM